MPKLPADLPENWTQGQTISPNGTETGLTEQHGYNYLMKQVNNTQTEVNNINGALPDVAQQATVNEINNKIGKESDADTQPTLFGRLAQLKKVLLEKLAELLTKVTGIDGKIGTSGDTAGSTTLFGQVKDISEKMPTGIIKSVQEILIKRQTGLINGPDDLVSGTPYYYDFSIGKVDASKTIVLTTNYARLGDTGVYRSIARIIENGNKLRVYSTDTNGTEIENTMIQIIEYM